jgi:hypothetical protein
MAGGEVIDRIWRATTFLRSLLLPHRAFFLPLPGLCLGLLF